MLSDILNNILKRDEVRLFITLFTGVLIGYTLKPIPHWLLNLFNDSYFFKFMILFLTGIVFTYPLNNRKICTVILFPIVILVIFHLFRLWGN